MASQGYSLLLQLYLLLMLARPLSPSNRPERDMGTVGLLPEELELQDMDPEPTPLVDMVLVSWTCLLMELLITGVVLGCCLGRRLQRRWKEVREGGQAGRTGRTLKVLRLLGSPLAKASR